MKMHNKNRWKFPIALSLCTGALSFLAIMTAGCGNGESPAPAARTPNQSGDAAAYSTPAPEVGAPAKAPAPAANESDATTALFLGIRAPMPASWTEVPPQTAMHHAAFIVPGADGGSDAQLVVFGHIGGSPQANIERWEQQFRSADGTDSRAQGREFQAGELKVTLVELEGDYRGMTPTYTSNQRFLAAIINTPTNEQFFIRLVGDHATVTAHRDAFIAMVEGMEWAGR